MPRSSFPLAYFLPTYREGWYAYQASQTQPSQSLCRESPFYTTVICVVSGGTSLSSSHTAELACIAVG